MADGRADDMPVTLELQQVCGKGFGAVSLQVTVFELINGWASSRLSVSER